MAFSKTLYQHLEQELQIAIQDVQPLSGGDINQVFKIRSASQIEFVVKVNSLGASQRGIRRKTKNISGQASEYSNFDYRVNSLGASSQGMYRNKSLISGQASAHSNLDYRVNKATVFPKMFLAEAKGLQTLAGAKVFRIPQVMAYGEIANESYLVLEYIYTQHPTTNFWKTFGIKLAQLHQHTNDTFGFTIDNYMGSLPQYNTKTKGAVTFYIEQRLEPQFQLAAKNNYIFSTANFYKNLETIIPEEQPALIHGDLWSGNFLADENNQPVLIDPATCYAPREMDIAMMHLFGGFQPELFTHYHTIFPLNENWKGRLRIWQLYYLLVHLNLFGRSYYAAVKNILTDFS